MPLNKGYQRRIEIIDACLRRRQRNWTIEALLDEVNEKLEGMGLARISQRSLYNDIRAMRLEYDAPIETFKFGPQTCYRYANPDFSIRNLPLAQEEVGYLRDALDVLSQIKGFQLTQELEAIIGKLENTLATTVESRHTIIQFEHNGPAAGSELLDDIFQAIKGQTTLAIRYKPFEKDEQEMVFHPYLLKEYRNRWFLLGRRDGKTSPTTLALDRILKVKPTAKAYQPNDLFDPETYFDAMVGVTLPEDARPERILLQLQPELAPYVLTKPIHPSQKLVKSTSKAGIRIELEVVNNYELRSLLLGLGPGLKVLAPQLLRDQMQALYEKGLQLYQKEIAS